MLTKVQTSRTKASNWLLISFILVVLISAFITEFFQAPTEKTHVLNQYRRLIEDKKIEQAASIIVKNSLGSYTLSKEDNDWNLTKPRKLPANTKTTQMILSTLGDINIRKVYQSDTINLSNFSLDSSDMEFSLIDAKGSRVDYILGLVNPIDNSTYIHIPQKEIIYQVDALKNTFESLDLSDFIDSKIFSQVFEETQKMRIYRNTKSSNNVQISFELKKDVWVDKNLRGQDKTKVEAYLRQLFDLKSTLIVDKSSDELKKELNLMLEKPLYFIEVTQKNGTVFTYTISHIINTLPDLKIEKRQHVLIKASDRKNIYLIHKDNLPMFSKRQNSFKDLNFKKLFY
ncbi:MAG: hypothetical protein ACJAT2_001461 [Bacteriovoracaceae bacterium]|jgi:hypothetical protein